MTIMASSPTTSSGARKAAVLLVGLGRDHAARVLSHLSDHEVEAITSEIAQLRAVAPTEAESVITEFRDLFAARGAVARGGFAFAQHVLEQSMGVERASGILGRLQAASSQMPFQFLHQADPAQLRSFIADEHPQVIALVLAHMTADKASLLLSGLPPEQQAQVAHRIAVMDRTSPEILRSVEATLERKLSSVLQPSDLSAVGGLDQMVHIINCSDRATERQIVEGLESLDPRLAEEVRSRMFMFADIVLLDDRSIQQVLREVETGNLALALKGVANEALEKITNNLSTRAAENLLEEVSLLGPVRLSQVEDAQQSIIRTIRQLEERGEIMIRRGNDAEFID